MSNQIGLRFNDETFTKLNEEAESRQCTLPEIVRQRIERSYELEAIAGLIPLVENLQSEVGQIKLWQEEFGRKYFRAIAGARNLSWFSVMILCEHIRKTSGEAAYREITELVKGRFPDFMQTGKVKI